MTVYRLLTVEGRRRCRRLLLLAWLGHAQLALPRRDYGLQPRRLSLLCRSLKCWTMAGTQHKVRSLGRLIWWSVAAWVLGRARVLSPAAAVAAAARWLQGRQLNGPPSPRPRASLTPRSISCLPVPGG